MTATELQEADGDSLGMGGQAIVALNLLRVDVRCADDEVIVRADWSSPGFVDILI